MLRSRFLLALALVTLNACSMTFDGSKLGVPVTMGSKAGAPAKGQPFKVSSGSLWVLWGAVPVKKPSLRQPLSSQLVGGQTIEDLKITVGSRWYDVLVSVITLGIVTPRTVTLEGVIVGDPTANLPGADYTPAPTPVAPGVAAAPVPVTTPMGPDDPTSQPYDLSVTQGRSAFEITPMVAYIFGGGFDTDALDDVPPGSLSLRSGIGYGAEIGFTPNGRLWFEGTYMRQTTDITFIPDPGFSAPLTSSGFATNYIHGGARYEFGDRNVHPFLGLGIGATIFDPSRDGIGSSTNFSVSAEGGVRMMLGKGAQQRFGVRATVRGWWSFVPNGTYNAWCDYYYGCYATEGNSVVAQGEGSLGLIFTF
jgi:hypothetical protein